MIWRLLMNTLWLLPVFFQVDAPLKAAVTVSNQSPLVGEPVVLTLTAQLLPGTSIAGWPEFSVEEPTLELRAAGEVEIIDRDGRTDYQQSFTIVFWEPGVFQTPELLITYQANNSISEFVVEPASFSVVSVLDESDLSLRPFKPVIDLPYISPHVIVSGICLLTSGAIGWLAYRQKQQSSAAGQVRALDRKTLAALKAIDRNTQNAEEVYAAVAECLRDYIRDQFQVEAHELTTNELVSHMQAYLPLPAANRLSQIMGQADLVKFAKQTPDRRSAKLFLDAAATWIQNVSQRSAHPNGRVRE